MSKGSLLSILGLYTAEPTLFDNMVLPEGMNRETVIDAIMQDCMELEAVYTSPYAMKLMIGVWSRREQSTFERVYRAEREEYNPIENYDRHQSDQRSITRAGKDEASGNNAVSTTEKVEGETTGKGSRVTNGSSSGHETSTNTGKETSTSSGSETSTSTEKVSAEISQTVEESGSKNETNTHKYAAFDSGNLNDQTQDVLTSSATNDQTTTGTSSTTTTDSGQTDTTGSGQIDTTGSGQTDTTGSTSETMTENSSGTSEENKTANTTGTSANTVNRTENTGETFTSYIHGNIGVTTSQQMLQSELELAPKINTINYVVNSFKMRFCILVY